jgi:hypothetical protein
MKIEEIKTGLMVMITKPIEEELDGVKRRKGIIGMIDSPVFGSADVWWWVTHSDGAQAKYRYCEISQIETKSLEEM